MLESKIKTLVKIRLENNDPTAVGPRLNCILVFFVVLVVVVDKARARVPTQVALRYQR